MSYKIAQFRFYKKFLTTKQMYSIITSSKGQGEVGDSTLRDARFVDTLTNTPMTIFIKHGC